MVLTFEWNDWMRFFLPDFQFELHGGGKSAVLLYIVEVMQDRHSVYLPFPLTE